MLFILGVTVVGLVAGVFGSIVVDGQYGLFIVVGVSVGCCVRGWAVFDGVSFPEAYSFGF